MQLLVDQADQRTEFGAGRGELFAIIHVLHSDELLDARTRSVHVADAGDVIACLQCE
jgi:hypothetical protein